MKILKTNFYSNNEVPFILLNLLECYDHVDKFLVYEFNYTKSGIKKEFVDLYKYWDLFDPYVDKFDYHQVKMDKDLNFVKDESGIGEDIQKIINEPYSRNYFTNMVYLNDDDLIFSVDADEIIYSSAYEKIEGAINENDSPVKLHMHFFWKKINGLTNKRWGSSCASKFSHLKDKLQTCSFGETRYPQWRDEGVNTDFFSGCHFSNCYSSDDEFEYRKKAIYYKPTTEKTTSVDLDSDIMPKKLKETYSTFKEFNLL
jgi:hypothetical protein